MYTVMARKRGMEDPFNDISRYSQKYKKVSRKAPKLDARPYGLLQFLTVVELEYTDSK
jgi:DNA-directed RNA polymerase III subunit RPC7